MSRRGTLTPVAHKTLHGSLEVGSVQKVRVVLEGSCSPSTLLLQGAHLNGFERWHSGNRSKRRKLNVLCKIVKSQAMSHHGHRYSPATCSGSSRGHSHARTSRPRWPCGGLVSSEGRCQNNRGVAPVLAKLKPTLVAMFGPRTSQTRALEWQVDMPKKPL